MYHQFAIGILISAVNLVIFIHDLVFPWGKCLGISYAKWYLGALPSYRPPQNNRYANNLHIVFQRFHLFFSINLGSGVVQLMVIIFNFKRNCR